LVKPPFEVLPYSEENSEVFGEKYAEQQKMLQRLKESLKKKQELQELYFKE